MCIAQAFYSQKLQLGNTFEQYIAIYGTFYFFGTFQQKYWTYKSIYHIAKKVYLNNP